jgi:hypothetical protein
VISVVSPPKLGKDTPRNRSGLLRGLTTISRLADSDSPCGFSFAVALLALQIGSSQNLLRDFAAACRKMSPLVEFTTRDLGLEY